MRNEFEKPLLEAKDSVKKVQILLHMLENINISKLKFVFDNHLEYCYLPVNKFNVEDLVNRYNIENNCDSDPNDNDYMGVIEYIYQLVYVIAVHNKEISTIRRITDGKDKVTNKENVLSDYERGVLDPELDEDGDLKINISTNNDVCEAHLIFTELGNFFYEDENGDSEGIIYKNTFRLYLAMKRFFESENNE